MSIYQPSDDSFFFAGFLRDYLKNKKSKNLTYLDMGSGSGILSETASEFLDKNNITAVDINKEAVDYIRKQGFNSIKSDLFKNIRKNFDLITFNAPYLPEDQYDNEKDTTGGKKGDETAFKFLKQAKKHLNEGGKIFLLISSWTPMKNIKEFNPEIVAKKKLFFEELMILEVM